MTKIKRIIPNAFSPDSTLPRSNDQSGLATDQNLSELYASVVGPEESLSKLPIIISRDLEERFIRDGWPVGRIYGGEVELATYYQVGRDVMREAVRILESRDSVRMRRGPHGGLEVTKPCGEHLRDMIGGYAYISGISLADIVDAWTTLSIAAIRLLASKDCATPLKFTRLFDHETRPETVTAQLRTFSRELIAASGNGLLACLNDILTPLLPPESNRKPVTWLSPMIARIARDVSQGRVEDAARRVRLMFACVERRNIRDLSLAGGHDGPPVPRTLDKARTPALAVVQRLMADVRPEEWVKGRGIGNEFDLCERYGVDRSIIRQAIRMMEDAGTATTLPGRGRGLMTRRPGSAPLSRQICAFLASNAQISSDALPALDALMIEMASAAARKFQSDDNGLLEALFENLRQLDRAVPVSSFQPLERLQNRIAHTPLISLFIDGVKAYLSWTMLDELVAPYWVVELYADATRDVLRAIRLRDAPEAARFQAIKLETLRKCRRSIAPAHQNPPPGA